MKTLKDLGLDYQEIQGKELKLGWRFISESNPLNESVEIGSDAVNNFYYDADADCYTEEERDGVSTTGVAVDEFGGQEWPEDEEEYNEYLNKAYKYNKKSYYGDGHRVLIAGYASSENYVDDQYELMISCGTIVYCEQA